MKIKAVLSSFLVILWFYGVSILSSFIIQWISSEPEYFLSQHSSLVNLLCYLIIFLGVFLFDSKREDFINALQKLFSRQTIKYILIGFGIYIIGLIIIGVLIPYFPDYQEINQTFNDYEPNLQFLMIVIAAPFLEEYLFRHKIQGLLKKGFSKPIAVVGQALCFGLLHFYNLQKIYATVIGVLFGFIKERKGIEATIWMHMTVNFIGWFIGNLV